MAIVERHEFNSEWWGADVGIVRYAEFFMLSQRERAELLSPYAWVEFKHPRGALSEQISRSGFFPIDCQLGFRLDLSRFEYEEPNPAVGFRTADRTPFRIEYGTTRSFDKERFRALPGITPERLDRRYVDWANQLISECPAHAIEVTCQGVVQGWYLGRPVGDEIELTLVMLHRGATLITGRSLYGVAFSAFAKMGSSTGFASVSANNLPSLNLFAWHGVQFNSAMECWLWVNPLARAEYRGREISEVVSSLQPLSQN